MKTIIIAEAGVNHNGDIDLAKKMIVQAANAGADFVKFQTFISENLVSGLAKKAKYQQDNTGGSDSQLEMLKKLELSNEAHLELIDCCRENHIQFLSTPFDLDSIEFLQNLKMPFWKIPSGEITNYPYLIKIAQTGKDIVLSTGMCNLIDIRAAIELLRSKGCGTIRLLHCNTQYPTPYEDVNLHVMDTLKKEFQVEIGYSDHTLGYEVAIAAVAMGATIIEKHFTLDRNMTGPDHKASLIPEELKEMIQKIRHVEISLGNGIKEPTNSEKINIPIARKSIVAKKNIKKGDILSEDNLTTKRPGYGLSPMLWETVVGLYAIKDFEKDDIIEI